MSSHLSRFVELVTLDEPTYNMFYYVWISCDDLGALEMSTHTFERLCDRQGVNSSEVVDKLEGIVTFIVLNDRVFAWIRQFDRYRAPTRAKMQTPAPTEFIKVTSVMEVL